ncbi:MAG: GuaB3 family IMP dehydrogenase-related protein [Armatimonadetes bacterium]|nr:GuaB3 family IMP dehydrogenase-related protein [Armatimonadota bacterium]MDW8121595.1 GuaB3 family IMP dehydrogenase-related protein [Armatimonadota bacterium]
MEVPIGKGRTARKAYSLDEISLVPAPFGVDPDDVDVSLTIKDLVLEIPILASAMDAAVDEKVALELSRLGGLAVFNLEGLHFRYDDVRDVIDKIVAAPKEEAVSVLQEIYREPIKQELIEKKIGWVVRQGGRVAAAATPGRALDLLPVGVSAGACVAVVQSTVTTARFRSRTRQPIPWERLIGDLKVPVIVGNCVSYEGAWELMEAGADGVLVGVGPGAACTTRQVVGVGVPQATAIADVAAARDDFEKRTGKRVVVIADGGMRTGADLVKALACGADGLMIGSPIAATAEAPGRGYHWGMAMPHPGLPRGTRIYVGQKTTLKGLLLGPASRDDGTQNLVGALRNGLALCGAHNIKEMHQCPLVIAPTIGFEGKGLQKEQGVGQGR